MHEPKSAPRATSPFPSTYQLGTGRTFLRRGRKLSSALKCLSMYPLRLLSSTSHPLWPLCLPRNVFRSLRNSRSRSTLSAFKFRELITKPTAKHQIFVSLSRDPYTNLSIEHFLLQNSPADSTTLFVYVNKSCVVIGRNQNPWLEANLRLLRSSPTLQARDHQKGQEKDLEVMLVRRKSGGGTVFHDEGNVNYSVICPTADFSRDKHVEMVVQAIRKANQRARVNERHDVVMDQGDVLTEEEWPHPSDMHRTIYASGGVAPLKVSGSAYKLIRQKSLHHGTCLLASPNLEIISDYLHSPAKPFMNARGVESVRSPVGNVYQGTDCNLEKLVSEFQLRVVQAFSDMYSISEDAVGALAQPNIPSSHPCPLQVVGYVDDNLSNIPEIHAGIKGFKSQEWVFGQTPQFILSSHAFADDDRVRPPLPEEIPSSARIYLEVRAGVITSSRISLSSCQKEAINEAARFDKVLRDKNIQKIGQFQSVLCAVELPGRLEVIANVSAWLDAIFGK